MKPSGRLTGGNDMDGFASEDESRPGHIAPETVAQLETIFDGHVRMIRYLQNIHDSQFAPYCNLFIERIEKEILPILEEAIVAAKILMAMDQPLPEVITENLHKRIQQGIDLPPYDGGGLLDR